MALLSDNNNLTILKESTDYDIYSINGNDVCLFCLSKNANGTFKMYLDLNEKSNYESLISGNVSKDTIIDKLSFEYDLLKTNYQNAILVAPNFDKKELENVFSNSNGVDKQAMFNAISGIGKYTKDIQSIVGQKGISIDSKINIICENDLDTKLADWLQNQNIGQGIKFSDLSRNAENINSNPFMTESQTIKEPQPSVNQANPFSNPTPSPQTSQLQNNNATVNNVNSIPNNMNPDAASTNQTVTEGSNNLTQNNVNLTPVEGVSLETPNLNPQLPEEEKGRSRVRKIGNKGYVNIVVLMAVLVGVTMLSIQLGKVLYNIYG